MFSKLLPITTAFIILTGCDMFSGPPLVTPGSRSQGILVNPADVVRFKGKLVATELFTDRLAIFDSVDAAEFDYFDPSTINQSFNAPHHLAVTNQDTLLISSGWGKSIVEIRDLDGSGWKEFSGVDKEFKAPHGICVDKDGWIYVADSLNFRIVRFRDMDGKDWQVFSDHDKKVAYVRQMICNDEGIWAANGYEKEEGHKRGSGGSVLLIRDFESGKVEKVIATHSSKITGFYPMKNYIIAALWRPVPNIRIYDRRNPENVIKLESTPADLGIPYAMYFDPVTNNLIQTYFGSLRDNGKENIGGLRELKIQ